MAKACRYDHVAPRAISYSILTTYKASHLLALSYLPYLFQFYQPSRTLRSSSEILLVVYRKHLRQYGDRSFCITPYGIISHAICENVTQYTSLKDSLKFTYSKELFIHEFRRTFNTRLDFLWFQDLRIYLFIILSYFLILSHYDTLLFISIFIS